MKRIVFSAQAKADLRAIPQQTAMQILTAIHRLAETGAGRVKTLEGQDGERRLRVGDFRVRFTQWRRQRGPGERGHAPHPHRAQQEGGVPLMGYEAKKTEHSGPKRGNGAYWGYKWEAKKESNRIRRENWTHEIRHERAAGRGLLSLMRRHRHNLKPEQKLRLLNYLAERPALNVIYRFKQRLC